jgi:ATP-dependent helicase/nuclease subunit A
MSDPSLRASDPVNSAWVAANAGAGKTHTLANRVTRLLLSGAKPERILCLTYTKAAAAEMQERLFNQLGLWAMLPDETLAAKIAEIGAGAEDRAGLRKARRLFAQALETPGGPRFRPSTPSARTCCRAFRSRPAFRPPLGCSTNAARRN